MPRKKKVSVEIVRKPSPADMKAMLNRMMRENLDEILAERSAGQLEPVSQRRQLHQHPPGFDRVKYALYFEKWGCKVCGRKRNVSHMCKGRCAACQGRYHNRMAALEREYVRNNPESRIAEDIDHLTRRLRSARELLGEGDK